MSDPASQGLTRVVAIASTPRSGSTLLGKALGETGLLGRPAEHFNPYSLAVARSKYGCPNLTLLGVASRVRGRLYGRGPKTFRYTPDSMRRYLAVLAAETASPNGVLSVKAHWSQFSLALLNKGLDLGVYEVPIVWLRTHRRDRLRQAISLVRATQTQRWTAKQIGTGQLPEYDAVAIRKALRTADTMTRAWDEYFASLGVSPYVVEYEDLDGDYEGTITAVLDHLGVEATVPPRQLERQADELNEQWRRRFLDEAGDDLSVDQV